MSDAPSFGHWLRQRRRRHDLTQAELAKLVGYAVGTLRNIETDDARPSKQLAAKLARVLGVAEADLDVVVAFARGTGPAPLDPDTASEAAPAAPALPDSVHTPAARHDNLPAQLTGLIGRVAETEAVRAALLRPDVRLVTLTGSGGTGKTRVAVESAVQLRDAFADGVTFVDLAAITEPDLVLATIAQTLGIPERRGQPLSIHLAAELQDQARLLLLDNFEQVIDAAASVAELLAACPQMKVLITSRIVLGVAGEHEWPVPPLALPDRANPPPLEQLTQYECVRLFSERARAVLPSFAITTSNAPAVAEICHQLDGLPLAIELAAARVKLFTPQALLARLDHRLTFLTGGARDRPNRQQTIRNTIDWSYHLLTPDEQTLLQRVSVFVGGGTLAAIEAVCGDQAGDTVEGVTALVNHSLLRILPDATGEPDAESRFGMFETIREYALEQLARSPAAETVRWRHARYFMALAEDAAAHWSTPQLDVWLAQLQREHDNMRAALQWAHITGDSMIGLRTAGALWKFWQGYGYTSEGRAWLDHMLTLNVPNPDPTTMVARLSGLQAAAWLASEQRDDVQATHLLEQSMLLRRALRETNIAANPLVNTARQARTEGDYGYATAALEQALASHAGLRGRIRQGNADLGFALYDMAVVMRVRGLVLREQGQFVQAAALFEESLAMHRRFGDREGVAFSLVGLADVARDQGNAAQVRTYGDESLAILRDLGVQWMTGFVLNTLAHGALTAGDVARAVAQIDQSVRLFRELNAYSSLAEVLVTQGHILHALGDSIAALASMSEALRFAWAVGPRIMVAAALEGLAVVQGARDQAQQAVQLLAAAAALRAQMGTPTRPVDQPLMAHTLAMARATLGEETFAAAWAAADATPLEQLLGSIPGAMAATERTA